jgi:hypothetical protein
MTERESQQCAQAGWVEVDAYFDDAWRTPWPLANLAVRLDQEPVILSKTIEHNKGSKQDE